jgi:alpha-glucosidase
VVAIIDPGVKRESGYGIYDAGLAGSHFCVTPEGRPFVGLVWPGETVFPDFAQARTRRWWSELIAAFAARGFAGFWLDMNEPATGAIDPGAMLFDGGRQSHASYHNHYALGMAQASHAGLLARAPNVRPFLLTRAFGPSVNRYAAVWTGDNCSNELHLALSIPTTLNLALSGVPWNAPDVPGFGGDADADLLVRWYKTAFLFPFLRNHSCAGTRAQEPWAFGARALSIVRHFIRMRYKLLPYLYSLFQAQERDGDAILRPLFYDFSSSGSELFGIEDQFMVGPALMQAPLLSRRLARRGVVLPAGAWYEAHTGRWRRGGSVVSALEEEGATPLYVREGQLVPMQVGTPKSQRACLSDIELHVFLRKGSTLEARLCYEVDDGESFAYREGRRSTCEVTAHVVGTKLRLEFRDVLTPLGELRVRVMAYAAFSSIVIATPGRERRFRPRRARWRFTGAPLEVWRTPPVALGTQA